MISLRYGKQIIKLDNGIYFITIGGFKKENRPCGIFILSNLGNLITRDILKTDSEYIIIKNVNQWLEYINLANQYKLESSLRKDYDFINNIVKLHSKIIRKLY